MGGHCVICGSVEYLEFHHVNPSEKEFSIGHILGHKWDFIVKELDKCELRCYAHHKEEHAANHGTDHMYRKGCGCDLCIEGHRRRRREFMRMKRAEDPNYARK